MKKDRVVSKNGHHVRYKNGVPHWWWNDNDGTHGSFSISPATGHLLQWFGCIIVPVIDEKQIKGKGIK